MAAKSFSPTTHDALFGLIARLADNKYFLGRNYAEWCSGAPTLESAVAAAAMAQDELGHARALYPLLKTLAPGAGPEIEPETRTNFLRVSLLDTPFSDWMDFVAANFLTDNALTVVFEAAQSSTYEPLAGRSRKVLQEEQLHATHGDAWVRRLAREGGAVRATCEDALRRNWAETLCWFGPSGATDPLHRDGILDAGPDTLRAHFLAKVGPILTAEKLDLPVRAAKKGAQFVLTEQLPWDRWDAATYRLAHADLSALARETV
ncbi:MAG TPA: Phenylacetic acid catabolic protein [Ktedonobacterales bacterium]|nr:Phenylacetic acid catabolic protein [Ktedonobacterales bacterium]